MIAAFDTLFHRSVPPAAYTYAIPPELAKRQKIRRYGFHGLSHQYLVERYTEITGTPLDKTTIITLHLERGCSICAIQDGRSVETSMGFTPLEGLVMGTRSGDIDPALVGLSCKKRATLSGSGRGSAEQAFRAAGTSEANRLEKERGMGQSLRISRRRKCAAIRDATPPLRTRPC